MKKFIKVLSKAIVICLALLFCNGNIANAESNVNLQWDFKTLYYDDNYVYDYGMNYILSNDWRWLSRGNGLNTITNSNRRDRWTEIRNDDRRGWEHAWNEWFSSERKNLFHTGGYNEYNPNYDPFEAQALWSMIPGSNYVQGYDQAPSGYKPPWWDGGTRNNYRRPALMIYRRNKPQPVVAETYLYDGGQNTYIDWDKVWINEKDSFLLRTYGYDLYPNYYGQSAQYEANVRWLYLGLTSVDPDNRNIDFVGVIDGNNGDGKSTDTETWHLGKERMEYIKTYWRGYTDNSRDWYDGLKRNGIGAEISAKLKHMEEVYVTSKAKNKYKVSEYDFHRNFKFRGKEYSSIKADGKAPTVEQIEVENITMNGYDVYVYGVTDNDQSGVKNVKFPTWTEKNGQDDIKWYDGEDLGGGTWKIHVDRRQHNGELGKYNTHIYTYDNVGNEGYVGEVSPKLIDPTPMNGVLEVKKYNYKDKDNLYWIKLDDTGEIYTDGYFPSDYDIYPSDTYVLMAKDNKFNPESSRQLASISSSSWWGDEFYDYFSLYKEYVGFNFKKNNRNYLGANHIIKGEKHGSKFKLYFTNAYNYDGEEYYRDYEETDKWIQFDGIAPGFTDTENSIVDSKIRILDSLDNNTLKLNLAVKNLKDDGSGIKSVWAKIYPPEKENKAKIINLTNSSGDWILPKTDLYTLFKENSVMVDIYTKDNVGNTGKLQSKQFELFTVNAYVVPYNNLDFKGTPTLVRGQKARLKIFTTGGPDMLEIKFPKELSALDYSLDNTLYIEPKDYLLTEYDFYVPLEAELKKYKVNVKAFKTITNSNKESNPDFIVDGSVLSGIRTRLR